RNEERKRRGPYVIFSPINENQRRRGRSGSRWWSGREERSNWWCCATTEDGEEREEERRRSMRKKRLVCGGSVSGEEKRKASGGEEMEVRRWLLVAIRDSPEIVGIFTGLKKREGEKAVQQCHFIPVVAGVVVTNRRERGKGGYLSREENENFLGFGLIDN
ncbi:hypothetical protein HAX54_013067, partial [Datura stramonium]|nr:hypothetical protein [Datura stramonium]